MLVWKFICSDFCCFLLRAPPPLPTDQNFLNFMQFFGEIWQIVYLHPLLRGILDPPLIYHGDYHIYCILGIFSIALPFRYIKKFYIYIFNKIQEVSIAVWKSR